MRQLIKHMLKESSTQSKLLDVIVEDGIFDAADMVGGIENLKRIFKDNPKIITRINALEGKLLMTLTFRNGRHVTLPFEVNVIGKKTTPRGNSWPLVNVKYDRNKFNDFENKQIELFILDAEDQGSYEAFLTNYEKFQSDYAVQVKQINGKEAYVDGHISLDYDVIRDIEDKLTGWNSHLNKSEDTHKEEETEGAGGYEAPAFEMEPDHVHFKHLYNESEITEKCWKGYTQKGMKTMFGKKYPNCVKMKKKKSLKESIKNVLDEEIVKKYAKPTEKIDRLVYNWLNSYFDGSQMYVNEVWKDFRFDFEFCKDGKEIASISFEFDDTSPDWGDRDKRPLSERKFDQSSLSVYPVLLDEIQMNIPIRRNYLGYLIEEWFEDVQLEKIQNILKRNDLSVDKFNEITYERQPICVPPVEIPEDVSMDDMVEYIMDNTLFSREDLKKHEEDQPGWVERIYLSKLRDEEKKRVGGNLQENIRIVLREETNMKPLIYNVLNMLFEGFDDIYFYWASYNCGMGECCDPHAIGFTLPNSHADDYLFLLVDDNRWEPNGNDYPEELKDELPEVCYEQPDIKNPRFNKIILFGEYSEQIEDYLGSEDNWKAGLLELINEMFGCNAERLIVI